MIPGFVLAGGASRRFGADKALHPVEGVPMAARVARAMAEVASSVTLVAPDRRLEDLGWPLLVEPAEGPRHPLRGVVAALAACAAPRALLCPCDLPWMTPQALAALVDMGEPAVAAVDGRVHPLVAALPVAWLPRARALLEAGAPCRALVEPARIVPLPAAALRNVNRPEDVR
ncbi:MAG: NTP transferase domain-containing protein [Alphaproteobacteria bacterium]|nr:NTP transferase domain-containing protein [Alphaproteobacteria bacterium]